MLHFLLGVDSMTAARRIAAGPYFFLGPRPYLEAECAARIRREHGRGRLLADVLGDPYFERIDRTVLRAALVNPELIKALGEEDASAIRALRVEIKSRGRATKAPSDRRSRAGARQR